MSNNSDAAQEQLSADPSTSTFVSSLVFNAVISVVLIGSFGIARTVSKRIYAPRTYLVPESKRSPPFPKGVFGWIPALLRTKDEDMKIRMGLDRYMFLRLLRMGIVLFAIITFFCIPILIPLNYIDGYGNAGINVLTIGNVRYSARTWAHMWLAVGVSALTIYAIFRETRRYIQLRHEYLLDPEHVNSPAARTILVSGIPPDYNNVEALRSLFDKYPGGVRQIWLNRKVNGLPDQVNKRFKMVKGLEGAHLNATRKTMKQHQASPNRGSQVGPEGGHGAIPDQFRPTHRVNPLPVPIPMPCIGQKVDSITYYEDQIMLLNKSIEKSQSDVDSYKQVNSAFIEFNQQIAAHMASQTIAHHKIMKMTPRYIEIAPEDIEWANMNIDPWVRIGRQLISYCASGAIIVFWAIPVAFVSSISSLSSLATILPFLSGVNNLPPVAVGVIQGILPAIALSILMALLPVVFVMLARFEGIPRRTSIEMSLLQKYFVFQFFNVVLVTTIANAVFQASELIQNPTSIVSTLAQKLPQAATFFITYIMLQATISAALELLQIVPLILSWVFSFLASTPRSIWAQKGGCSTTNLGTLIPSHTVVFVLGLLYSTIAPLVLPFVLLFFITHYFVYLHQFLYVYDREFESGGQYFPRSMRHIWTGLFLFQLTMIGILAIQPGGAVPQFVIMIICLVVTAFAMGLYDKTFKPMFKYLPVSLANPDVPVNPADINPHYVDGQQISAKQPPVNMSHQTPVGGSEQVRNYPAVNANDLEKATKDTNLGDTAAFQNREADIPADQNTQTEATTYLHPSLYSQQPTVWLAEDDMGITFFLIYYEHANESHKGKSCSLKILLLFFPCFQEST
ncbi:hypothetical protein K450DRAFT_246997 [Umbelopsis ramanniana AG]|uniref:DUF221-domain-containing protein n=1 Tax=Umbelopsis ramanniana AG TaxID=1314678 RepID=A0AAD5E6Q0_UMBRA|nr:uncharacterized protein K450DRAFT_246997 [Umbelopsis ramanniana AG]KAI8578473.1 hypothetical protein K450DRAFT_246997 [Umbelopsis ramanniana AG]